MELKDLMNQIKETGKDGLQKVASATAPAVKPATEKTAAARTNLLNAMADVLTPPVVKTAAVATPEASASATNELVKMASTLATAEEETLKKEAALYGAAVADGFMARLQQYTSATTSEPMPMLPRLKTANVDGVPTQAEFEKFASENPDLVKQAIDLGYLHGKTQVEQLKEAAFAQGYTDAEKEINELQKTAAGREQLNKIASEVNAQSGLEVELEKLAETPEGRQKLAEVKQGYDDTMGELTKMANDTFERGYRDTVAVLQAM